MQKTYDAWPALPYEAFQSTNHLLHMAVQIIGKLKLHTPFEPHWSNVALWLTSRGLTTGLIPYQQTAFSIDFDFIEHIVCCNIVRGEQEKFQLNTMSVAEFAEKITALLQRHDINIAINSMPQEISNPIPFHEDKTKQFYNSELANAWWRILISIYRVMQQYHARFDGESPPIGLMWGTFDIRDARYNGIQVPTTGINAGYIRRNAMNEAQIEIGWWPGNELYPRAAFYSFTYPKPNKIESAKIHPASARWDEKLMEFVLDYDDLRKEKNPDETLLTFFNSTYEAGATLAEWDPNFITRGEPV